MTTPARAADFYGLLTAPRPAPRPEEAEGWCAVCQRRTTWRVLNVCGKLVAVCLSCENKGTENE